MKREKLIKKFKAVRTTELQEAIQWINKGNKDAVWHWESESKQAASLEGSYEFFLSKFPTKEEQTEDNIIRFCGQEIYDLWGGYEDDNIQSRQNHCAALYAFILEKLNSTI